MEQNDILGLIFLIILGIPAIYSSYLVVSMWVVSSGCRNTVDYNSKYHSLNDKPSRVYDSINHYGVGCIVEEWHNQGVLHRKSGPARTVNYNILRPYLQPKPKNKYFYIDGENILTSGEINIKDLPIGSRFTTFDKNDLYEKVKENKDRVSCEALKNGITYCRFNYKNPDGTDKLVIY